MVKWSHGSDVTEVPEYHALGTISSLTRLQLALDVSDLDICQTNHDDLTLGREPPPDPSFNDADNRYCVNSLSPTFRNKVGHVRRLAEKCQVSEAVARSIFRTISKSKPPGAPPLEKMHLNIRGQMMYRCSNDRFRDLVRWLSGEWFVRRNTRRHLPDRIVATSLTGMDIGEEIRNMLAGFMVPA
ncbi:hypothetical protein BJX99DRAFT_265892 [Aspergillus californicus]